jgi:hypothetical protein
MPRVRVKSTPRTASAMLDLNSKESLMSTIEPNGVNRHHRARSGVSRGMP